jgi:signal transduction histidine kinase
MSIPLESIPAAPPSEGHVPHLHRVQFYEDDAYLLDEVAPFTGRALESGGAAVVIATLEHREALADRLTRRGLSTTLLARSDRYFSLDARETLDQFMVDGHPDRRRFAQTIGAVLDRAETALEGPHGRIAAFGEMVALLYAEGNAEAALELEELWNDLARSHAFALHCAYPLSTFAHEADGAWLGDICGAHNRVMPAESFAALATEDERGEAIALLQQKARALEFEVAERKRAQEALAERNRELAEAVAVRDVFLSVAAHELKTPLTGIRLGAELVQRLLAIEPMDRARVHAVLGRLDLQTAKLARMVEQLLDVSRLQKGHLVLEPGESDLTAIARSVVESARATAPSREIRLAAPDTLMATADSLRLEQAIANLVDNAVKYSPNGGPIDVELAQLADGTIRLAVRDRGVGIPPESRDRVFEPFYRVPSHDLPDGMGLGLHITRQIVTLHGGRLGVESPDDGGTRFIIELPLWCEPAEASGAEGGEHVD